MKLRITPGARWEARVKKAKEARRYFREVLSQSVASPDEDLKAYADVAEAIDGALGSLEGGFAEVPVDTTRLKELVRRVLPFDSKLRMLIESENASIPYSEWLVLVDRYRKLMIEETKNLPSGSSAETRPRTSS
jgi:hypothetical protein